MTGHASWPRGAPRALLVALVLPLALACTRSSPPAAANHLGPADPLGAPSRLEGVPGFETSPVHGAPRCEITISTKPAPPGAEPSGPTFRMAQIRELYLHGSW